MIPHQRQFLGAQREAAVWALGGAAGYAAAGAKPQLPQSSERLRHRLAQVQILERGEVAVDAAGGGVEPIPQRLEQRRVGEVEGVQQQLRALGGVVVQVRQVTVARHLGFRKMLGARRRPALQRSVAGNGEEELIVDGRQQDVSGQLHLQRGHLVGHLLAQIRQIEPFGDGLADLVNVRRQLLPVFTDAGVAGIVGGEFVQLHVEQASPLVDAVLDLGERLAADGGHQKGRRVHQVPGALGDAERRGHLRHAALVHAALGLAHPVEREPSHQAGHERERHRRAEAGVQLGGDPKARLRRLAEALPDGHRMASRNVSIGR